MKQFLNLLIALNLSIISFAQTNGKIFGTIKNAADSKDIATATVYLLDSKDSSVIKTTAADKTGNYHFTNIKEGKYLISASSIGCKTVYSKLISITKTSSTLESEPLQLVMINKDLKEFTVISKKLLIERKIDKTVVNVDASVTNAGTTAMDVLEKSPGVTVDKDGNISLKGKQGVMVMLDGKPSYLNSADLANLLRSMSSTNLDQIEIMTNPSAKYDAAGNSGIINIKTKKNKQKGFNGSVTLGYGQGVYAKTNNSLNLNYKNGKFNLFSTISVNRRNNFQQLDIKRIYKNSDKTINAIFDQSAYMQHRNGNNNVKIGADYYANKNTTIGLVFTGFINPEKQTGLNKSLLKNQFGKVDSIAISTSAEDNLWKNGAVNLNLRHQFDSTGKEFTMDVDYIGYNAINNQPFNNITYLPNGQISTSNKLLGELPTTINIYSAKADYVHPFKGGLKIETGLKTSFVNTDNTAGYFNIVNEVKMPDYEKTNRFRYKENINAAYLNASKEVKKCGFQLGIRLENTT